ncbi:hypothetical protein L6Q96_00535 [Candidatus Binatia bacterium]|nr:hypothetical protein [Candidatus Binatia bacterium]
MSAIRAGRPPALLLALLALVPGGCARPAPGPVADRVVRSDDPARVFAAVRARERSVQTIRARFVVAAVVEEETRRADGVMLVKRPDRVRLRLVSPFGLTVLDYTRVGDRSRLLLPLEGRTIDGSAGASDGLAAPADFGRLLLRLGDDPAARCTPRHDGEAIVVDCVGSDGSLLRSATIDPTTATVTREVAYADRDVAVVMELSDYGVVDNVPLPFRLRLAYPRSGASTDIRVRAYELNPELDDALFDPSGGGA